MSNSETDAAASAGGTGLSGPLVSRPVRRLSGRIRVSGDKSISHRALMLGALAVGETRITGLLEGEDVRRTAAAMTALGAHVARDADGAWRVRGRGVGGLAEAGRVLEMGNSGTSTRLLMGIAAAHPFVSFFAGDASLSRRPMNRVIVPLERMGARVVAREGGRLPLAVVGGDGLRSIVHESPVASAQVKSAVLLAGLNASGETTVIEPLPSRDHSERLLRHFGATLREETLDDGRHAVTLEGQPELTGAEIEVPGDISSAAFPLVAALSVAEAEVMLSGVGINPLRDGLIETLLEMGADIVLENCREAGGEPVADITVRAGRLKGVTVPAERAPRMIDEYPALAVAAAFAEGETRMLGLGELRVKESDRLRALARGLAACGVAVEESAEELVVRGAGRRPAGGACIAADLDHRIAMAFLTLGLGAEAPIAVDDAGPIVTSFPGFAELMNHLGGEIVAEGGA